MIEHAGSKATRFMADTAILGGRHVIHWFAGGWSAMAGGAVIHDTGVIKHRVKKTTGDMTDAAILGRRKMVDTSNGSGLKLAFPFSSRAFLSFFSLFGCDDIGWSQTGVVIC